MLFSTGQTQTITGDQVERDEVYEASSREVHEASSREGTRIPGSLITRQGVHPPGYKPASTLRDKMIFSDEQEKTRLSTKGKSWTIVHKPVDEKTDTWAIEQGNISISPLLTREVNKPSPPLPDSLCSDLFGELQQLL